MVKLPMQLLIFSELRALAPYLNGWMTTFSSEYHVNISFSTMLSKHNTITRNSRCSQSGSHLWYLRENLPDNLPAEFDEDVAAIFNDSLFSYCDADIDTLSEYLGIPWKPSKTILFSDMVSFLGFQWNLSSKTVEITKEKKTKYKAAIKEWFSHTMHTLDNIQKLYSKLLHTSLMAPAGQAYLTSLETMLGTYTTNLFMSHHPP
jgi:hypothetical protein